ncbi:MAG: GIY-YIG nuclease family protein [Halioglobus sp.]
MAQADLPRLTQAGCIITDLPKCPGVYRFLDDQGSALYIGKSINVRTRVKTHLANARSSSRQHRMVTGTDSIDVRPTAGEVGALLLENEAIKQQTPVFNRRQRSVRRMWSFTLIDDGKGFAIPQLQSYSVNKPDILATYGAYSSRWSAKKALERTARESELCPQVLRLEAGSGPCFNSQIGRCRGACSGLESPQSHNGRLQAALCRNGFSAWPITEPVLLHEVADDPAVQPAEEWHLLHNWAYLGTFDSPELARSAKQLPGFMFDKDTYQILRRTLNQHQLPLLHAVTLEPVEWLDQAASK